MTHPPASRFLALIERAGNRLPDPTALFLLGTFVVMLASQVIATGGWSVSKTMVGDGDTRIIELHARSLMDSEGIWWLLSHMVENFVSFPPLGVVLVGMLGIGLAERCGLVAAVIERATARIPGHWLTPSMVFLGILSSLGLDAGYVVLPPIAAVLYLSQGRSPLAGIAAVFAGVSAGFSANLFITAIDPLVAGFTQSAAQIIEPDYRVAVTANWWFMIVSTLVLSGVGWWTSDRYVEARLPLPPAALRPEPQRKPVPGGTRGRALRRAGLAAVGCVGVAAAAALVPGAPLHGQGEHFPRWVEATVPLLLLFFFVPALVFGLTTGSLRGSRDVARMLGETMAGLGPYIVLAFFAAQFVAAFKYTHLGEMLAISGGTALAEAQLDVGPLVLGLVFVAALVNLFVGSMSAKYAFFAPVFVPMLMLAGVSPELTQAAYRVGDSITNVITPLNPYFVIVLGLVRKYAPESGIGTVLAMMIPYTLAFAAAWCLLLAIWVWVGVELGPGGGLHYPP